MVGKNSSELPPGFRFHPTDEELIMYYLRNQATSRPCPVSIIPEVDIYKFDPWELPDKAEFGENEWYFFTPRDRKYPNGIRPNRAAVSGYWKATGTDKAIYSGSKYVGVKKALVFYKGKPPKGVKTDWIMHEYRLSDSTRRQTNKQSGSMRLDDWVLCRIYKKKNSTGRAVDGQQKAEDSSTAQTVASNDDDASNDSYHQMLMKFPRTGSLSNLWELEYCLGSSLPQLLSDNSYGGPCFDSNNHQNVSMGIVAGHGGALGMERIQQLQGVQLPYQYTDSLKLQANNNHSSSSLVNQPIFVNPTMYQFH